MSLTRTRPFLFPGWATCAALWRRLGTAVAVESYLVHGPAAGASGHSVLFHRARGDLALSPKIPGNCMLSILCEALAAGASVASCCVLCPERPLLLAFRPPPSPQLINSPLLCLLSRNASSYWDVLPYVDTSGLCVSPPSDWELLEGRAWDPAQMTTYRCMEWNTSELLFQRLGSLVCRCCMRRFGSGVGRESGQPLLCCPVCHCLATYSINLLLLWKKKNSGEGEPFPVWAWPALCAPSLWLLAQGSHTVGSAGRCAVKCVPAAPSEMRPAMPSSAPSVSVQKNV